MQNLQDHIRSLGPAPFYRKVCALLNEQKVDPEDFSFRELAEACGLIGDLRSTAEAVDESQPPEALLSESSTGLHSRLFQVVAGELIGRKVIEGYENDDGFIGHKLVTISRSRFRNQKIVGFTALAGPREVAEGHPYEESTFDEKFVTTEEAKKGRILSINEELIAFDQTGEILRRALAMGHWLRQERERTIVRGVTDADAANGKFVYRPAGSGESLYAADGSNRNFIGVGNTTSTTYNMAVPLEDWTDVDEVRKYRATQVVDDRIDGTPRPFVAPAKHLLVPEALLGRAKSIVHATETERTAGGVMTRSPNPLFGSLDVLSSPFIDEQAGDALSDWYLGDFPRQFVWSEVWPVQTFLQRSDSAFAFDRDVVLRVKVRYYGGLSAVDTVYVTKVDGV